MSNALDDRYSRQRILPQIGNQGQERLAQAKVLVLGCGALGSAQAELLVRAGVGHVRLVDRDIPEWSNLQRQHLFDEADVQARTPKALAGAERLRRINSSVTIEPLVTDATAQNMEKLLDGMDLILDGLDNFETRYLLNDACVKMGIPWFYGAVQGTTAFTLPVIPGEGPCFRCVFPEAPAPGTVPTCNMAGVLGSVVALAAAQQVTLAMRWLVAGTTDPAHFPVILTQTNIWTGSTVQLRPARQDNCPCCGACEFPFLDAQTIAHTRSLCGRAAVQVSPAREQQLDLAALEKRIAHFAQATLLGEVLEITEPPYRMVVFRNGRAIVHGTTDHSEARKLVAKYIG